MPEPTTTPSRLIPWLPGIVAGALAIAWATAFPLRPDGDEPHYLIMADSIVRDFDLRLENNYERDCLAPAIYGCVTPHGISRPGARIVPYHQPGLSFLLAPAFAAGGVRAARLAIGVCVAALLLIAARALGSQLDRSTAGWLTAAAFLSLPVVAGATAIYPDLLAGLLILVLWLWVSSRSIRDASIVEWTAFWLVSGLLCWLNLKYLAVSGVLWLAAVLRLDFADARSWEESRRALATSTLALVGPIAIATMHYLWFETVLGVRGWSEMGGSPRRALMIFLGLHLDQSQGIFVQNTALLAGVPTWVIWCRRDPKTAWLWMLLYLAAIAPNAFQMARYGGGPIGRFGWSAAWLWIVPIAQAVSADTRLTRILRAVALIALVYQFALALLWWFNPRMLFATLGDHGLPRDSLFPPALQPFLPSFYFWSFDRYLMYPPNAVSVAGVLMLAAVGWLYDINIKRRLWPSRG